VNTWSAAASMGTARSRHSGTLLPNGRVLVAGGDTGGQQTATAELYDPTTDTWSPTGALSTPRAGHTAIALADGSVLVVGGYHQDVFVPAVERFAPGTGTWLHAGTVPAPREAFAAVLLDTGSVLVCGGSTAPGTPIWRPVSSSTPGRGRGRPRRAWSTPAMPTSPRSSPTGGCSWAAG
jgi:N-acetylneuraminic acid mutarotase